MDHFLLRGLPQILWPWPPSTESLTLSSSSGGRSVRHLCDGLCQRLLRFFRDLEREYSVSTHFGNIAGKN